MREPEIGSYCDGAGARHIITVRLHGDGVWHVLDLDIEADTAQVVDTLTDKQDCRPEAEAIAHDYLTTVGAHKPGAGPAARRAHT